MLTRRQVTSQYATAPGDRAAPPLHVAMPPHQRPAPTSRAQLYGAGGLMGGAVTLTAGGPTGMRRGRTGYGYLGMDPSDPSTWPRPFVPSTGMISYLNFGALV
jgi:hypothetical protein